MKNKMVNMQKNLNDFGQAFLSSLIGRFGEKPQEEFSAAEIIPSEGETQEEEIIPGEGESQEEEIIPGEGETQEEEIIPGEGESQEEEIAEEIVPGEGESQEEEKPEEEIVPGEGESQEEEKPEEEIVPGEGESQEEEKPEEEFAPGEGEGNKPPQKKEWGMIPDGKRGPEDMEPPKEDRKGGFDDSFPQMNIFPWGDMFHGKGMGPGKDEKKDFVPTEEEEDTPTIIDEETKPEESIVDDETKPEESIVDDETKPEESIVDDETKPEESIVDDETKPEESIVDEETNPEEEIAEEITEPEVKHGVNREKLITALENIIEVLKESDAEVITFKDICDFKFDDKLDFTGITSKATEVVADIKNDIPEEVQNEWTEITSAVTTTIQNAFSELEDIQVNQSFIGSLTDEVSGVITTKLEEKFNEMNSKWQSSLDNLKDASALCDFGREQFGKMFGGNDMGRFILVPTDDNTSDSTINTDDVTIA